MLMEEMTEGKAKQLCQEQQGRKESRKELMGQEPPIPIPSEKEAQGVVQPLAVLGSGRWLSRSGAVTRTHRLQTRPAPLPSFCSLPPWEDTSSCNISALPSTMSPCQEPSLAPLPKHREATDKNPGVATPLCCHKSPQLKINCC